MNSAAIPMKTIGPIKIIGPHLQDDVKVPLATFETPLWPSVSRGACVSRATNGISAVIIDDRMTRSIVMEAPKAEDALKIMNSMRSKKDLLAAVVEKSSRFARLADINFQIVANLLYIRFELTTGDASGHNMVTKAADHLISFLLAQYPLKYISISGNFCVDKKVSAVNGILGRGKYLVAEITIPREVCKRILKTTPEKLVEINLKKNLLGSILAGSLRSANAHFANMLLAIYLATGQDGANIVEGSQGFVYTEMREDDLYFSVTLPNIIVGTVGNSKKIDFVRRNLEQLGCLSDSVPRNNANRLAAITAATVLCGELSLLAAQTNQGILVKSHLSLERRVHGDDHND